MKKKLLGIYLPEKLINRLKKYIHVLFIKRGEEANQSQVVEEALTEYLNNHEIPD